MRYIRYACIAIFGVALIVIALANRQMVTVKMLPSELNSVAALNPGYEVPLFVVMFGGILAGLVLGFLWEYIREHKERAARRTSGARARPAAGRAAASQDRAAQAGR